MHLGKRKLFLKNQEVKLSRKEFDIFRCILESNGEILTYEQLHKLVWGERHEFNSSKALMLHVHRLKEKIQIGEDSPEYIKNIREIGYRLNT